MASDVANGITPSDKKIRECIDKGKSFVLDAGAGSGKTRSLIEALRYLIYTERAIKLAQASQRIACITYTNVAKDEIIERTANSPLIHVSTIHEFLWSNIGSYQKELKILLLQYNQSLQADSSRKCSEDDLKAALEKVSVTYSDTGPKFVEGRIFHDDLLNISYIVFQKYKNLCRIVSARYPYIFVDEYQDTSPLVIDILIEFLLKSDKNSPVIGFFGDKLQNIYQSGVGEIPQNQREFLDNITKEENYRCSTSVIKLLNKIRTDIQQKAAGNNVPGKAAYFNVSELSDKAHAVEKVCEYVRGTLGWDLDGTKHKELFLTHKLIAKKAGYENLLNVFDKRGGITRDKFLNGEDKHVVFFRDKLQPLVSAWRKGDIGKVLTVLTSNEYRFKQTKDKARAKEALEKLVTITESDLTIREILDHIDSSKLLRLLDDFEEYLKITLDESESEANANADDEKVKDRKFYNELFKIHYSEVVAFCNYLDENTPFSTKHGVKGTEYHTVLVILDDKGAKWNLYSFDKYLSGEEEGSNRFLRTRNLFYVCCSRAEVNLAVIDLGAYSDAKRKRVQELFGADNCYKLTQ